MYSYKLLCSKATSLALLLPDAPSEILQVFDAAAKDVVLESFPSTHVLHTYLH